jgi:hypothetical protein
MANGPTPATVTFTELGTQPAESEYFTEKVKSVLVVPVPGVAFPWLRLMVCDGLLQLAASAAGAAASMLAVIASAMTRRRTMAVPSPGLIRWMSSIAPYDRRSGGSMHQKYGPP